MSKFNDAHQEPTIDMQYINVLLLEPNLTKRGSKKGLNYVFFRNYATGSGQKIPEMVKSNSAHQELSIEVRFATLA